MSDNLTMKALHEKLLSMDKRLNDIENRINVIPPDDRIEENRSDDIHHPSHYTDGKYEVWDFIDDYGFGYGYHMGCAIKYMSRAGKKDEDTYVKDLRKAREYLFHWHNISISNPDKYNVVSMDYSCFPKNRINISDYCKDKGLPLELTKAVNFIILGQIYNAYIEVDNYIKYLQEET